MVKRIEITRLDPLDNKEEILVDHHSLLNVLNVLERQLEELNTRLKLPDLKDYSDFCVEMLLSLSGNGLKRRVEGIKTRLIQLTGLMEDLARVHKEQEIVIQGILQTLGVAVARIEEFQSDRFVWRLTRADDIRIRLFQFLEAVEKVSRGRFHFAFEEGESSPNSYLIDLRIECRNDSLRIPKVLEDTLRDLVGNARKYSRPGTVIRIHLSEEEPGGIRLRVQDEGLGIPAGEIDKVVQYGYRASNVLDHKTMGGGYGLTKAYMVCKRFGGRFFIESSQPGGTAIELTAFPPE